MRSVDAWTVMPSNTGWRRNGKCPIKVCNWIFKPEAVSALLRGIPARVFLQKNRIDIAGDVQHDRW